MFRIGLRPLLWYGVFAFVAAGSLFSVGFAQARPKGPGCFILPGAVVSCASEGDGCWRPQLTRHCITSAGPTVEVIWTSPFCFDDSDADADAIMDAMCEEVSSNGGYGVDPGTPFPFDFELAYPEIETNPCASYENIDEFDFPGDGEGAVYATRHPNGCGIIPEDTAFVHPSAYVAPEALVYGNAMVDADAQILGSARVFGNAIIMKGATVSGAAIVKDDAVVKYGAEVRDDATIKGSARVECGGVVEGNAVVSGSARVHGFEEDDRSEDCGPGYAMAGAPGVVGGSASVMACTDVGPGEEITEGNHSESCS